MVLKGQWQPVKDLGGPSVPMLDVAGKVWQRPPRTPHRHDSMTYIYLMSGCHMHLIYAVMRLWV